MKKLQKVLRKQKKLKFMFHLNNSNMRLETSHITMLMISLSQVSSVKILSLKEDLLGQQLEFEDEA